MPDSITEKEANTMDRITAGPAVSRDSLAVMTYMPMPIVVPTPKNVRSIVDKVLFRLPSDSRVR